MSKLYFIVSVYLRPASYWDKVCTIFLCRIDLWAGNALRQQWRPQAMPLKATLWRGEGTEKRREQCHQLQSWRRRVLRESWVFPNWPIGELQSSSSPCSSASLLCLPSHSSSPVLSDHSISLPGTGLSLKRVSRIVCFSPLVSVLLFVGLTAFTSLSATATYDFLAIEDTSKDKVMDILFVLKNTDGSKNTCADEGIKCYSILVWFNSLIRRKLVGLLFI